MPDGIVNQAGTGPLPSPRPPPETGWQASPSWSTCAILHSKTALVDGVWATVGSTNLDWRGFLHNHELNAVVLGANFGAQLQALFERDQSESDLVTLERWHQRGLTLRLQEAFACAWEYWL